ncbi:hypothetical protein SMSP2_02800 [Limihaloglobus sulfuriphilus]|uniref:Uncharacterized protein n=1 Tax=Limihaloglobus sulfuriphilus TaxID=1851148 RepID=A0A1R7T670_9BACT|nr:hypothetical protein [Limihaloglobus sulfuriphilus]AQQ72416.1 hypothetical protein SMSP2_02800 [Limihaloglobus sulfuriphilus]
MDKEKSKLRKVGRGAGLCIPYLLFFGPVLMSLGLGGGYLGFIGALMLGIGLAAFSMSE